ncbi:MAG TPA: cation diffusion facilitator family transporter, partial [Bacteroidales bacterium]|nr:cation diffusion facilitator family transporter [Bacteroidales bacterium]
MNTTADSIKIKVQKRIVVISIVLFVAKISVFFITNSVGILTDALESIVNIVTAIISLYSIRVALKPYDDDHPFGHGKVEMLSASLEGILIILAGIFIIYESVSR